MSRRSALFESLQRFYEDPEHLRALTLYTSSNRDSPVSLRLLDWLVTNYAKKHNVVYPIEGPDGAKGNFNMFMDYKAQLKAYSKRFFDPFCRRERIEIRNANGEAQTTTVAQMNFVKWMVVNKVGEYALRHKETIEQDMMEVSKKNKEEEKTKRHELSSAAIKNCTKTYCHVTVRFQ
jgi:hypothetical protein